MHACMTLDRLLPGCFALVEEVQHRVSRAGAYWTWAWYREQLFKPSTAAPWVIQQLIRSVELLSLYGKKIPCKSGSSPLKELE